MVAKQTIALLESFVSGSMDIGEFERHVSDRLFELRQKPAMSEEKRLLSRIQLCLHEADEGSRDVSEVYKESQAVLDSVKSSITPV